VRELDHAVERAVLMAAGERIGGRPGLRRKAAPRRALDDMSLEEVECLLIKKALARHDGNVSRARGRAGPLAQRHVPPPAALRL
jgi:DNA-binding NtrC family response regulator